MRYDDCHKHSPLDNFESPGLPLLCLHFPQIELDCGHMGNNRCVQAFYCDIIVRHYSKYLFRISHRKELPCILFSLKTLAEVMLLLENFIYLH